MAINAVPQLTRYDAAHRSTVHPIALSPIILGTRLGCGINLAEDGRHITYAEVLTRRV